MFHGKNSLKPPYEYHRDQLKIPMILMREAPIPPMSLKDASERIPDLPSLVTLKRMSAAGKLDKAVVGTAPGRYQSRLYDCKKLAEICASGKKAAQDTPAPLATPPLPRPQSPQVHEPGPPHEALGSMAPTLSHAAIEDIKKMMTGLQQEVAGMKAQIDDLFAIKRALQVKYDAENQALRSQRDELKAEVALLRTRESQVDAVRLLSKINQISSKLGL